jgi:hypothetical protein
MKRMKQEINAEGDKKSNPFYRMKRIICLNLNVVETWKKSIEKERLSGAIPFLSPTFCMNLSHINKTTSRQIS